MQVRYLISRMLGCIYGHICMIYYQIHYTILPPKSRSILFVAHPDDDTLFFHTFIKKNKPFVVCMSTAYSWRRLWSFQRTMRYYGVEHCAFCLANFDKREDRMRRYIKQCLKCGQFSVCVTHAQNGEYRTAQTNHGHEMHMRVHRLVVELVDLPVLTTVGPDEIKQYPIPEEEYQEKVWIYKNFYTTELFCLSDFDDWMKHEKIVSFNRN